MTFTFALPNSPSSNRRLRSTRSIPCVSAVRIVRNIFHRPPGTRRILSARCHHHARKARRGRLGKPGGKRDQNRTMGARSRARPISVACRNESCARTYAPLQNRRNGTPPAFAKPGFIPLNAAEQKALNRSYFLCDLYWEQAKLAIEYDSDAEHSGSERIASDAARRNALLRLGITVITVGNQTFRDRSEFKRVGATVARLLRTRIRPRSEHYDRRQIELRERLSSQPI